MSHSPLQIRETLVRSVDLLSFDVVSVSDCLYEMGKETRQRAADIPVCLLASPKRGSTGMAALE